MTALAITSLFIGAAMGLRFQVFALFPVMFLSFLGVTATGLAHSEGGWSILLMNITSTACLQLGYLAGTLLLSSARELDERSIRSPSAHAALDS